MCGHAALVTVSLSSRSWLRMEKILLRKTKWWWFWYLSLHKAIWISFCISQTLSHHTTYQFTMFPLSLTFAKPHFGVTNPFYIHFHAFEVPAFVSPAPDPENDFPFHLFPSFEASMHLRDPVRKLLQSLSTQAKRVIVIHDSAMASVAQDATNMPNVENYTFHSTCAFSIYIHHWDRMGRPPVEVMHALKILSAFFVKRGHFDQEFVKKNRLNFFLQNKVKPSWWRTTLKVKPSSTVPVSFFYFQKAKPCSQKPISIYFKSEVVIGPDDFTYIFNYILFSFF